jgi:hypothetical protein
VGADVVQNQRTQLIDARRDHVAEVWGNPCRKMTGSPSGVLRAHGKGEFATA